MAKIGIFHNAMDATLKCQSWIDVIQATMATHTSWTQVDTVNSPGGMPCTVWKCAGADNGFGTDWYFYIARTENNPAAVYFACSEGYDSVNKKAIRPAPGSARTTTGPSSTDGSYGGGLAYSLWTGATGSTLNTVDLLWRSYDYATWYQGRILVTKQYLVVFAHDNTSGMTYSFGPVEQLYSTNGLTLCSAAKGEGVLTRHPYATAAHAKNWAVSGTNKNWTIRSGGYQQHGDRFFGLVAVGSRSAALIGDNSNAGTHGFLFGLYKNCLTFCQRTETYIGDTITVNGGTYMTAGENTGWFRIDVD